MAKRQTHYLVTVRSISWETYRIPAITADEAVEKVYTGEGELLERVWDCYDKDSTEAFEEEGE